MSRFRFTVRGLMLAIAVVAAICGLKARARAFTLRADHYQAVAHYWAQDSACELALMDGEELKKHQEWNEYRWKFIREMERKYRQAARCPWLPVAEDLPEPEGGVHLPPPLPTPWPTQ